MEGLITPNVNVFPVVKGITLGTVTIKPGKSMSMQDIEKETVFTITQSESVQITVLSKVLEAEPTLVFVKVNGYVLIFKSNTNNLNVKYLGDSLGQLSTEIGKVAKMKLTKLEVKECPIEFIEEHYNFFRTIAKQITL